jgi:beta-glucosidase
MDKFHLLFQNVFSLLTPLAATIMTEKKEKYLNPKASVNQRVNDVLERMTVEEKIGQMMQVDHTAIQNNPSDITKYFIGSVLSGGDSEYLDNSTSNWANLHNLMQSYALQTRLKIPLIYGIDAVHGNNNIYGATLFPHNIGLGCTRNAKLVEKAARITAEEISATGIEWDFAPCIAVPRNIRWGRNYEGFGETQALAQILGAAQIKGLQGKSLKDPTNILACAKHFVGDGGTTNGIDRGNTEEIEAVIRKIHLPGYISAIHENVGSIMASFNSINGEKVTGSKYWLTDVLKNELGFDGFVVSDWGAVDLLGDDYKDDLEMAINAGIDMVMLPFRYLDYYNAMMSLVEEKKIPMSRIDDAVSRILRKKFELGLFEKPFADRALEKEVGSPEHRAIARQCVRESLVLLKKKNGSLPLKKNGARILVAGTHADNLGYQCGGWTLTWQGGSGNDITVGTTILEGMRKAAPEAQIDFSETGDFTDTKADYSVVVVGEKPYTEWYGDSNDLNLPDDAVELIKKVKNYNNPVIVVLISGRPLIIEKILHYSDAIIAAWLPGSEGDGVSDVLFGDYSPVGLLSNSWPKSMEQIPINIGDDNYAPLYEYGYGITSFKDSPTRTAPNFLSSILTGAGKKIELTFDKPMKDTSSAKTHFVITKNNEPIRTEIRTSLKPNDDTTIVLDLDEELSKQDEITVTFYFGNVESSDGAQLETFGPVDVVK